MYWKKLFKGINGEILGEGNKQALINLNLHKWTLLGYAILIRKIQKRFFSILVHNGL